MNDHIAAILIVQVLPVLITLMLPTLSPRTPLCNSFVYHLHPPVITLVLLYVCIVHVNMQLRWRLRREKKLRGKLLRL